MNKKLSSALIVVAGVALILLVLREIRRSAAVDHHDRRVERGHDGHGRTPAETVETGPHGGRLLRAAGLEVEVLIFERGTPPKFRAYFYENGEPVDPAEIVLSIELRRLGGRTDRFGFRNESGYALSAETVEEPHSFDVRVTAIRHGRTFDWEYESHEGRAALTPEAARISGIVTAVAGPTALKQTLKVTGRVGPNEDRTKHVVPRYPGILKAVRKRLGESVAADEVLAVVESNESLQRYDVKSDLAGTVIRKHAVLGEFVQEGEAIFLVADLSTVWVDFDVYRDDFRRIKVGQAVKVDGGEGLPQGAGRITYVSPFGAESTQTVLARVVLPNPDGEWLPGLFVTGEIVLDEVEVPVAVRSEALQTFREQTVVFLNEGEVYEAAPVNVGRRNGDFVEIISGVSAGQRYAAKNSFIIKADILKSGAGHDH